MADVISDNIMESFTEGIPNGSVPACSISQAEVKQARAADSGEIFIFG